MLLNHFLEFERKPVVKVQKEKRKEKLATLASTGKSDYHKVEYYNEAGLIITSIIG